MVSLLDKASTSIDWEEDSLETIVKKGYGKAKSALATKALKFLDDNGLRSLEKWKDMTREQRSEYPEDLVAVLDKALETRSNTIDWKEDSLETIIRKGYGKANSALADAGLKLLNDSGLRDMSSWRSLTPEQKADYPEHLVTLLDKARTPPGWRNDVDPLGKQSATTGMRDEPLEGESSTGGGSKAWRADSLGDQVMKDEDQEQAGSRSSSWKEDYQKEQMSTSRKDIDQMTSDMRSFDTFGKQQQEQQSSTDTYGKQSLSGKKQQKQMVANTNMNDKDQYSPKRWKDEDVSASRPWEDDQMSPDMRFDSFANVSSTAYDMLPDMSGRYDSFGNMSATEGMQDQEKQMASSSMGSSSRSMKKDEPSSTVREEDQINTTDWKDDENKTPGSKEKKKLPPASGKGDALKMDKSGKKTKRS
jgi:hypothetical protein